MKPLQKHDEKLCGIETSVRDDVMCVIEQLDMQFQMQRGIGNYQALSCDFQTLPLQKMDAGMWEEQERGSF